jgi:hypothetical protein
MRRDERLKAGIRRAVDDDDVDVRRRRKGCE